MRGISSYLAMFAILSAACLISSAQAPKANPNAQKTDKDSGLVLVTKGAGTFVKLAGGKLTLKYKEKDQDKNIDITMLPQVVVRVKSPPIAFDTKGKLKSYTKAELDELKGEDKKEWGYESNLNDLKEGSLIQVWLYRPKTAKANEQPSVGKIYIDN